MLLITPLITIATVHGGLYVIVYRGFDTNEPYMVEYQIAQSETSRAPHFAWVLLEKSLDQSDRHELHEAIRCHAFCSTAWLYPLFCTYSCQQYQLNTTQCSTSCGKCAQLTCPHTQMHSHIRTCIQIRIDTHNYYDHFLTLLTWLPMSPPKCTLSWIQQQKATTTFWPFLPPNQSDILSVAQAIFCHWSNYWQQIGNFQSSNEVAESQRNPAN